MSDLEWEDNKLVNVENKGVVSGEEGGVAKVVNVENKGSVSGEGGVSELVSSPQNRENEGRNRVPPRWTRDYIIGEELSEKSEEEDANINLALFASNPVHFKKVVKHEK